MEEYKDVEIICNKEVKTLPALGERAVSGDTKGHEIRPWGPE